MTAEEFFKHRYKKRIGDKYDLSIQQFDAYDMMDFAEQHARQSLPEISDEEIEKAAIEHEKQVSCNVCDDEWYLIYVNEDFTAGAEWYRKQLQR